MVCGVEDRKRLERSSPLLTTSEVRCTRTRTGRRSTKKTKKSTPEATLTNTTSSTWLFSKSTAKVNHHTSPLRPPAGSGCAPTETIITQIAFRVKGCLSVPIVYDGRMCLQDYTSRQPQYPEPCSRCVNYREQDALTNICWTCRSNIRWPLFVEKQSAGNRLP